MAKVLVTGASGFLAGHVVLQLLAAGHEVRASLRNLGRADEVRALLAGAGAPADPALTFCAADLTRDEGWAAAGADRDFVHHVASPLPAAMPKDENELIVPAREGTLRVLRAARDAGVRRVVLTSSFAAVGYGHAPRATPFEETDWTDLSTPGLTAYVKSKAIAERAAWDFIAHEGGGLELSTVNPVGIFGPVLGPDLSASTQIVKAILEGGLRACPRIGFGVVDVRDVADLHLRAMTDPAAKGERFLAVAGPFVSMIAIARALRAALGPAAAKVPTREVPDFMVRLAALVSPKARMAVPSLGITRDATSQKAMQLLGWSPRSAEEAVVATARSLLELKAG